MCIRSPVDGCRSKAGDSRKALLNISQVFDYHVSHYHARDLSDEHLSTPNALKTTVQTYI
jgi:hypothetical protein